MRRMRRRHRSRPRPSRRRSPAAPSSTSSSTMPRRLLRKWMRITTRRRRQHRPRRAPLTPQPPFSRGTVSAPAPARCAGQRRRRCGRGRQAAGNPRARRDDRSAFYARRAVVPRRRCRRPQRRRFISAAASWARRRVLQRWAPGAEPIMATPAADSGIKLSALEGSDTGARRDGGGQGRRQPAAKPGASISALPASRAPRPRNVLPMRFISKRAARCSRASKRSRRS